MFWLVYPHQAHKALNLHGTFIKKFSKKYYISRLYTLRYENDNSADAGQNCTAYQTTHLYQFPTLKNEHIHHQFVCQVHYSCDDNVCERYVVVTL